MDALKTAFADCLIKYWDVNHRWPQHILVFRDGVGDGQLEVTEKHEAEQFIRTFRHVNGDGGTLNEKLPEDYNPGFTFCVVQKRINTRIYLQTGPRVRTEKLMARLSGFFIWLFYWTNSK